MHSSRAHVRTRELLGERSASPSHKVIGRGLQRADGSCLTRRDPETAPGQHGLARCTRIAQIALLNHAVPSQALVPICPQRDSNPRIVSFRRLQVLRVSSLLRLVLVGQDFAG
jgi:hypothetical protein